MTVFQEINLMIHFIFIWYISHDLTQNHVIIQQLHNAARNCSAFWFLEHLRGNSFLCSLENYREDMGTFQEFLFPHFFKELEMMPLLRFLLDSTLDIQQCRQNPAMVWAKVGLSREEKHCRTSAGGQMGTVFLVAREYSLPNSHGCMFAKRLVKNMLPLKNRTRFFKVNSSLHTKIVFPLAYSLSHEKANE